MTIRRVLIANRGEIAVRCIRACRDTKVTSVAIYTISDASSLHVRLADESVLLKGDGSAGYLDVDDILRKCNDLSIDAVIPGYGFLSENVQFAQRVADAGMVFVGPSAESISEMGLKHRAREVAIAANVPVVPGTDLLQSAEDALSQAAKLGYPVMLKATGGGGGMGLQICHSAEQLSAAFSTVQSRGAQLFTNSGVLLEKYYPESRHIEVQVFGNGDIVVPFGERECSIQRRHQKVIEECPSPFVAANPELRNKLVECAVNYAAALHYKSAGTVEFLVNDETGAFFFLEMNTRLQVEHGITELCYDIDLVVLMLRQADAEHNGKTGISSDELKSLVKANGLPNGAAIEVRIYAENPAAGFSPSPGLFGQVHWPTDDKDVRIDTWIQSGQDVTLHYDPLLAKVLVHAPTRKDAIAKMRIVCSESIVLRGPPTNLDFAAQILQSEAFVQGRTLTNFLDKTFTYTPSVIHVIQPGSYTTVQDFPGRPRLGHGIPNGGPMDSLSARIANLIVGNDDGTELLEITLTGPELLFTASAVVSVCGADVPLTIDKVVSPMWSRLVVGAGQTLQIGTIDKEAAGCRAYIAIHGGLPEIPVLLGSRSTTPSLGFGGYQGRALRKGDMLQLPKQHHPVDPTNIDVFTLPDSLIPPLNCTEVYVMQGPHDSEDIMTAADREMLYNTEWVIGHNSSRSGVRLLGPAPQWARKDGGDAGSHPSNYLDYGYPSGGVNWGGDSPCIFSVDSPDFGGLVCSSTVISADMWKLGQLKPGAKFTLIPVSLDDAIDRIRTINAILKSVKNLAQKKDTTHSPDSTPWSMQRETTTATKAILKKVHGDHQRPKVVYRQAGDRFLLVEMGEQSPDVAVLARLHLLLEQLNKEGFVQCLTPHVGSVIIEYDPLRVSQTDVLARVHEIESSLPVTLDLTLPCREIQLPLVMDHPELQACLERYSTTVRSSAAYLPDNLEFLRACNGLASRRDVFDILLTTKYLVSAVGFLCGSPVLFPLNARRLLCPKFNPTRIDTPGGTVGVGGTLLHAYSNSQPGGYMLAARTLELWDAYATKPGFSDKSNGKPWLFSPFDVITFYEVTIDEYDALARDFVAGRYQWRISDATFDLNSTYKALQEAEKDPAILQYKEQQKQGLAMESAREQKLYAEWKSSEDNKDPNEEDVDDIDDENTIHITAPMSATLWKVHVKVGDVLQAGESGVTLEAMKLELAVPVFPEADKFVVVSIPRKTGSFVAAGDTLVVAKRSQISS